MIDIETRQPVKVFSEDNVGSYLMVPLDQLPEVRRVLEDHAIPHTVGRDAIQLHNRPYIAFVNFGRRVRAADVQAALDAE